MQHNATRHRTRTDLDINVDGMLSNPGKTRLVLVSPVPSMRTGTGNYLGLLVNDLLAAGIPQITVVTNLEQLPERTGSPAQSGIGERLFGQHGYAVQVLDFRCYHEDPADFCIYFAANNEFHFHVYALLSRPAVGRRWLVLHEPSCLMYAITYFRSRSAPEGTQRLQRHLEAQYGSASQALYEDIISFGVLDSIIHESFGFDWYSFGAEKIVVHSHYAHQKLKYELNSPHPAPEVVVRHHPPEPSAQRTGTPKDSLSFGVFGFINPSKRVREVLCGFAAFVRRIGPAEASRLGLELLIVGELQNRKVYDPEAHARSLGIERWVKCYGYVDKPTFERLLDRCDTIFNLRFPSCGETTGLAAFLRPGLHIAVSDYHAFREVHADFLIAPGNEEAGVEQVMNTRYAFHTGSSTSGKQLATNKHNASSDGLPTVSEEIMKGFASVSKAVTQARQKALPVSGLGKKGSAS